MAGMSLHRALIILSIFVWCAYVNGDGPRQVNCEVYVYHPNCRGMQARKRFTNSASDNDKKPDPACPCRNAKRLRSNTIDSVANSKLLEAMFANGFDVERIYDAYATTADHHRGYNNANRDRSNQRGRLIKSDSTDFGNAPTDAIIEDY